MIEDATMRLPVTAGPVARFLHRDLNDRALNQPRERVFSEAELAAAREQAFAQGHAAGVAEASAGQGATEAASLAAIAEAMRDAGTEAARVADESASALARALLTALSAVMPELVRCSALNEAGAMLAVLMPGLAREPQLEVIVPVGLERGVSALLDALPGAPRNRITVTGSGKLEAGEIRVVWEAGHAERAPQKIWETVLAGLVPAHLNNQSGGETT